MGGGVSTLVESTITVHVLFGSCGFSSAGGRGGRGVS